MTETTGGHASSAAQPLARRRWLASASRREAFWGFVFIGPWLFGLVVFALGPIIASLIISLTDFNLVRPEAVKFIGIDNYVTMTSDPNVAQSLLVTFKFALIAIPLTMAASLGLAVLVNSPKLFGRSIFRTLLYMPIQIPLVATTLVWIGFLNTETGWLNGIIGIVRRDRAGLDQQRDVDLPGPGADRPVGHRQLHAHQHRRAAVGADRAVRGRQDRWRRTWTMFRRITIPLMSPILLYNLVISLIVTFQYFTQAYTMTNGRGDPNNATLFINLDLYREAFQFNRMGYGAAIAWLLFVIVLILTLSLFAFAQEARLLRGRPGMTAPAEESYSSASGSERTGRQVVPPVPRQSLDHVLRAAHRQHVPAAAAVHGLDGLPEPRPAIDPRRAGLSGLAAHGHLPGRVVSRSTPCRSTARSRN